MVARAEGRGVFAYAEKDEWGWEDGVLSVVATPKGVQFAVEEEKAMDSYNQTFECTCMVPWDEVDKLIDMLQASRSSAG